MQSVRFTVISITIRVWILATNECDFNFGSTWQCMLTYRYQLTSNYNKVSRFNSTSVSEEQKCQKQIHFGFTQVVKLFPPLIVASNFTKKYLIDAEINIGCNEKKRTWVCVHLKNSLLLGLSKNFDIWPEYPLGSEIGIYMFGFGTFVVTLFDHNFFVYNRKQNICGIDQIKVCTGNKLTYDLW